MEKLNEKKKIWIVSELFFPEEDATAFIFTKIANYLTKEFNVNVICGPENYTTNTKRNSQTVDLDKEIKIYRTSIKHLNKNKLLQRVIRLLILSFKLSYSLYKNVNKDDKVLLATNPAPILITVGFIRTIKKFQLHILVHDVFPENTIAAGIFKSESSLFFKFIKCFFDYGYRQADHIIVLGSDMKDKIQKKLSKEKVISIVPNWSDTRNIKPISRSDSLISRWQFNNYVVFQYAGNIGRVQALLEIIKAFHKSNNSQIRLVIFGSGAYENTLKKFVLENSIMNVFFHGSYSREEQNQVLNACDISIVSLSDGMYGLGVPSKTYNILAAGKPILYFGESNTEISNLINQERIGWTFNIQENNSLINFFSQISLTDYNYDIGIKGRKARKIAEEIYSEKKILSDFLTSLNKVTI